MGNKVVFFGVMLGDLFAGEENINGDIDYGASERKYVEMCTKRIKAAFGKHHEDVEVDHEVQNIGGAIPYNLQTKIDGDIHHEDIQFVEEVIGKVWQEGEWWVLADE